MFFCYVTVPLLAAILTPELRDEETAAEVARKERPPVNWNSVFEPWEGSRRARASRSGGPEEVVVPSDSTPPLLTAGSFSSSSELDAPSGPAGDSGFTSSGPTDVPSGDVVIPPSPNGPNQSSLETPPLNSRSDPQEKADKAKRTVGAVATVANVAVSFLASEAAASVVVPAVNTAVQVANGLIDRRAAGEIGQDPEKVYPKRKVVGGVFQVVGEVKRDPDLIGLGGKISSLSDDILIP
jgi:hypothetical protein